jgi:hypothetical protein
MIDGMVNWGIFEKHEQTGPTNMMFRSSQHRRLFIILLGDFLSQLRAFKGPTNTSGSQPPAVNGPAV